jgi:hypothetical protein
METGLSGMLARRGFDAVAQFTTNRATRVAQSGRVRIASILLRIMRR